MKTKLLSQLGTLALLASGFTFSACTTTRHVVYGTERAGEHVVHGTGRAVAYVGHGVGRVGDHIAD